MIFTTLRFRLHILFFAICLSVAQGLSAQNWTGFADQPTEYYTADCQQGAEVCVVGIVPNQVANYLIELDGTVYPTPVGACAFNQIGVYNFANFLQLAPAGPYNLTGWTVNGVNTTGAFSTFQELVDLLQAADPTGNWQLETPLIVGGDMNTTYDTMFLQSSLFNVVAALGYSTGFLPTGISIKAEPGTHTLAITHLPSGFSDTLLFTVACPLTSTQTLTIELGNSGVYCPSLNDLNSLPVSAENICAEAGNTVAFSDLDPLGCLSFDALTPGSDTACLVLCDDQGFCDTTYLIVQVVSPPIGNVFVLTPQLQAGSQTTLCPPQWNTSPAQQFCADSSSTPAALVTLSVLGDCINITGIEPGISDTFCFLSCAPGQPCDTFYVFVTVTPPPPALVFYVSDTIYLATPGAETYCFVDQSVGLLSLCTQIGQSVDFSIDDACVLYSPVSLGIDTMCFLACGEQACDTLYLYITVLPNTTPDTAALVIGTGETTIFCADATEINVVTTAFLIGAPNNATLIPTLPTGCFAMTGLAVGADTVLIVIGNANGLTDTTLLFVFVVSDPQTAYVFDSIPVSGQGTYCFSLDELAGPVATVDQPCSGNGSVSYQINQDTWCVTYTGLQLGADTVCFVLCDAQLNCDTTFVVIAVADIVITPTAFDDFATGAQDSVIFVQVTTNDINVIPGATVTTISGPQSGTLVQIAGGIFTYAPNYGYCGLDQFTYGVCNTDLCDTATVTITIPCIDTLIVYNGFSPNGDGQNDSWEIVGISQIPNHQVMVFNRWGNLVFESSRYENNWNGTFQGELLPDGTYYYLVKNNVTRQFYSGYLQIQR